MMRDRSLRARLTLLFTLATTGLMLLVSGGIVAYSAYTADRSADRVLAAAVRRVRSELIEEGGLKSPGEMILDENEMLERADGAMAIFDPAGNVLAKSRRRVPLWPRGKDDGWRVASVQAPEAMIVIGVPWGKTLDALRVQALLLVGLVCCVALITAAGAWLLVGRTLRPIRVLARQADAASADNLRVRLKAPSEDAELVELVATVNRLLERITQTTAGRGRFYAAASHELRTPLQALSGHLELSLTRPRTVEEYRAVVEEASGQTRRLTRLVQDLLLLNQLHQGTSRPPTDPVDLAETIRRNLSQLRTTVAGEPPRLEVNLPAEAPADAPRSHVEILLRNLIENASKYAVPGSTVLLRLTRTAGGWSFEIYNDCSDAVDVRPEQVFEPFFRVDAARSSRVGGNGLGLAICKGLADANAWKLEWIREPHGVRVRVLIPAPSDLWGSTPAPAEERPLCAGVVAASR